MRERLKVLVVDDDRRMVRTICDILTVKGYGTIEAYNGEEAVAKVESERPDCVLMDIRMPGIDGVEALKRIKEVFPDIPVLLMSAYATGEAAREGKRQGAHMVITKPIDIRAVLSFLSMLRSEGSILIVDDDPEFANTLKEILQARGYKAETESDPDKVPGHVDLADKLLVILDIELGKADGIEVLRAIRSRYPSKPVILVTGYREEMNASIEKGRQIGAYACLYKPFETHLLIDHIEEIRRGKRHGASEEPF